MSSDATTSQAHLAPDGNGNVTVDRRDPSPGRAAATAAPARRSRSRSPYSPRPRRPRSPDSRSPPPRSRSPVRRRDESRERGRATDRPVPSSDICYQWKESGTCRFGNSCKFLHDAKYARPDSYHRLSNAPTDRDREYRRGPPPSSNRDRYDDRAPYRGAGAGASGGYEDRYRDDDRYGRGAAGGSGSDYNRRPKVVYRQPVDAHGNPLKRIGGEGQPCWSWEKYGECRYGDICKFDHLVGGGRDMPRKDGYDAPPRRGYSRERYDDRR